MGGRGGGVWVRVLEMLDGHVTPISSSHSFKALSLGARNPSVTHIKFPLKQIGHWTHCWGVGWGETAHTGLMYDNCMGALSWKDSYPGRRRQPVVITLREYNTRAHSSFNPLELHTVKGEDMHYDMLLYINSQCRNR